jgi:hypothetical protein
MLFTTDPFVEWQEACRSADHAGAHILRLAAAKTKRLAVTCDTCDGQST